VSDVDDLELDGDISLPLITANSEGDVPRRSGRGISAEFHQTARQSARPWRREEGIVLFLHEARLADAHHTADVEEGLAILHAEGLELIVLLEEAEIDVVEAQFAVESETWCELLGGEHLSGGESEGMAKGVE
jgi:hypothetical protein